MDRALRRRRERRVRTGSDQRRRTARRHRLRAPDDYRHLAARHGQGRRQTDAGLSMRWSLAAAAAFVVLATVAPSAQRSAVYDTERQVRLEGAVTRVEWVNPS